MADFIKKEDFNYTYADYCTWPDEERWEIIGGVPYNMSPAPVRRHQKVVLNLGSLFNQFFKDKPCEPYIAPFDVRLPEEGETPENSSNVVQPDLSVFCDQSKLDDRGAIGAPDLAVEVLSPSTGRKDMGTKFHLFERHGVKEYWIVHPSDGWVEVFRRGGEGKFSRREIYGPEDKIVVDLFPGLTVNLDEVFDPPEKKATENYPGTSNK